MRIHSSYKDYYDYCAYQWGGGDPKITYVRKKFDPVPDAYNENLPVYGRQDFYREGYDLKWLCVAGKLYLLVDVRPTDIYTSHMPKWEVIDEGKHPKIWNYLHNGPRYAAERYPEKYPKKYNGAESKAAVEISREIKAPVFTYHYLDSGRVVIEENVPVLADMGLPALVSPEQMYQDIAYFLGNTINVSPDMMPPTKMSDKEKIAAAGFDVVQSFRHRK